MAKYHVNPKTGVPGECSAREGNCPFGDEEKHFTSEEAARAAYESTQSTFTAPIQKIGLSEMNKLAKTTSDPQQILEFIENGSERTLANLAQNPHLTADLENAILDKTDNISTRATIFAKKLDEDYSRMTPEDTEELLYRVTKGVRTDFNGFYGKEYDFLKRPDLDEATYDKLVSSKRLPHSAQRGLPGLLALNNSIPQHRTRQYFEENGWGRLPDPNRAIANGKLTKRDLLEAPPHFIRSLWSLPPYFTEKEIGLLADVVVQRKDDYIAGFIARDKRTSLETLDQLKDFVPEEVYSNERTPAGVRSYIESKNAEKPFVRIARLKRRVPAAEFEKLIRKRETKSLNRYGTYNETTIQFDPELVRKYELSNDDIFFLGNAAGYNAGGSYDPETSTLTMRIDSGD